MTGNLSTSSFHPPDGFRARNRMSASPALSFTRTQAEGDETGCLSENLFQVAAELLSMRSQDGESDQSAIRTESFDKEKVESGGEQQPSSSGLLFSLFLAASLRAKRESR